MNRDGEADGDEPRRVRAAEIAIANPLLEALLAPRVDGRADQHHRRERHDLEVVAAARRVQEAVAREANIIFGSESTSRLRGASASRSSRRGSRWRWRYCIKKGRERGRRTGRGCVWTVLGGAEEARQDHAVILEPSYILDLVLTKRRWKELRKTKPRISYR